MNTQRSLGRSAAQPNRSGSVMVEFAFIALAFYLLFAGTIELGRMISTAQAVQNAARVGARELALIALPPTMTFRQALQDPEVRARIYNPNLLAVPLSSGAIPNTDSWPIINRMLTPLMIIETVSGVDYYQFPGALVRDSSGELTVKVPLIVTRDGTGTEHIRLVDVVEEVKPAPGEGSGPFSLASDGPDRGLVALRINCPYQAASLAAFKVASGSDSNVILANDTGVQIEDSSGGQVGGDAGFTFLGQDDDFGPYGGKYGLGAIYAFDQTVRPFRRLISSQSLFRREVYR
jgi:hypothetical protein